MSSTLEARPPQPGQLNGRIPEPDNSGPSDDSTGSSGSSNGVVAGILLILVGGFFLVAPTLGQVWAERGWPLLVIVPGLGLFAIALFGGKQWSWLAVPASIVTTIGLILWVQNAFNLWQTWAYAWALVLPTAVGFGQLVHGSLADLPDLRQQGRRTLAIGAIMFIGFAAFFEGVLNLSSLPATAEVRYLLPLLLIVVGAGVLFRDQYKHHSSN